MSKMRQSGRTDTDGVVIRTFAVRYVSPHRLPEHAHDWHQLVYASEGVMWVHTPRGDWVVPPNRAVWVPAGVIHAIEVTPGLFVRTLYVQPAVEATLPTACTAVNVSPLLRELILHVVSLGALRRTDAVMQRLIAFLLDQIAVLPTIPLTLPGLTDERARRAADWMRANPGDSGSLKTLARRVRASVRTLERAFRTETGMSLGRWRTQLRLLQALRLLAAGRSVTDVAMAVGYEGPSAFIAAFKRTFGTTPGRYLA